MAVGYRVNSERSINFQKSGNKSSERIHAKNRDIRSCERRFNQEITDIYADFDRLLERMTDNYLNNKASWIICHFGY